jgi:MoaA/NifB/PqqE/SkfB family radical SAM enzyme
MRREDMPKMEVIYLHTNAQLWTPRMWDTIPAEVQALVKDAQISIDAATAETYAVNRRGGKFETLLENLAFIQSLRASGQLRWLGFNMVVQENNFAEIPEFVRLGRRFGADNVSFQQLTNWGTFSDEEFAARAVHRPEHPRHRDLGKVLMQRIVTDPIVQLGNLTHTRETFRERTLPRKLQRALTRVLSTR